MKAESPATTSEVSRGPIWAELAQVPREKSIPSRMGRSIKNFFEISSENPDRTALSMRMLGGLAMTFGVVEYFAIGSQSAGELIADSIFELGGVALIAASYLPGRPGNN